MNRRSFLKSAGAAIFLSARVSELTGTPNNDKVSARSAANLVIEKTEPTSA
jgi:hypothetical protein